MTMKLTKRLEALEAKHGEPEQGKPFFWFPGQSLADALENAGLTLEDNLFAIRFNAVTKDADGKPVDVPDPLYERDRHLVTG